MIQSEQIHLENNSIHTSTISSVSSSSSSSMNFNNSANSNVNPDSNNNHLVDANNNINVSKQAGENYGHHMLSSSESLCNEHEDLCSEENAKTNLIVNYLPQNMTQEEIKSLFSSIGPVETCKLIKDKLTGQSLGYAFVNYCNQDDAEKAVSSLNSMRLQNKTIKVSYARPSSEQIKGANLYVCGLTKEFSQEELEKLFNPYGAIISSKILTDPKTGESKGVGFVRFDKRSEAENAINQLNGKSLESMPDPLVVKFANSPTSVKSVMGLPLAPFVTTCRGFFQPYRQTANGSYRYSPMGGAPPAAYCADPSAILHSHSVAATAPLTGLIQPVMTSAGNSLPSTPVGPAPLPLVASSGHHQTNLLTPPPPTSISSNSLSSINYSGWCIFVYNLGPETDENILWQLFGPFGAVQSVKIIRDTQTQKCKGFGFITMTNYEEAITAINCLNGFNLQNRILQVSFKTNNKQPMF